MPRHSKRRRLVRWLLIAAPVVVVVLAVVAALLSHSRASRLTSAPADASASGSALVPSPHRQRAAARRSVAVRRARHRHSHRGAAGRPSAAPSSSPASAPPPAPGGGSVCNSCAFPDTANTGVPAGASLQTVPGQVAKGQGWHYDPRGWVEVDGNGAVLKDLNIPYNVDVTASNVTIEDSRITVIGDSFGVSLRHTRNVTIENSEISSPDASGSGRLLVGIKDIYADSAGTVVNRDDIWHTSTGVQMPAGVIENSYIHDLGYESGDHLNGITSNGSNSGASLTIEHNTVLNNYQQTDAIGLFEDTGPQFNCLIEDNLLAGGGYTVYGGANPGGQATSNIRIINNRFSRQYHASSGFYGPLTAFAGNGSGNEFSGNVWDNTDQALKA